MPESNYEMPVCSQKCKHIETIYVEREHIRKLICNLNGEQISPFVKMVSQNKLPVLSEVYVHDDSWNCPLHLNKTPISKKPKYHKSTDYVAKMYTNR